MSLFIEGDSCGSLLSLDRHYVRAFFVFVFPRWARTLVFIVEVTVGRFSRWILVISILFSVWIFGIY